MIINNDQNFINKIRTFTLNFIGPLVGTTGFIGSIASIIGFLWSLHISDEEWKQIKTTFIGSLDNPLLILVIVIVIFNLIFALIVFFILIIFLYWYVRQLQFFNENKLLKRELDNLQKNYKELTEDTEKQKSQLKSFILNHSDNHQYSGRHRYGVDVNEIKKYALQEMKIDEVTFNILLAKLQESSEIKGYHSGTVVRYSSDINKN